MIGKLGEAQNILIAVLQTSQEISIVSARFRALCDRQVAKTILLLTQGAVSDRVVPATNIEPSCQLIHAQSIGSTADLILVTVASHIATTISLWDCVFVQATATIAFTYLGSALLYEKLDRAEPS